MFLPLTKTSGSFAQNCKDKEIIDWVTKWIYFMFLIYLLLIALQSFISKKYFYILLNYFTIFCALRLYSHNGAKHLLVVVTQSY